MSRLRVHPELTSRHRTIRKQGAGFARTEFFAFGEFPREEPAIPALWRDWRNPSTGYAPARLGLEAIEAPQ